MPDEPGHIPEAPKVERPRSAQMTERRYSYVDLASMFRISPRQVMRWVKEGRMPPPIRAGHRTLFTPEHVAFIESGLKPAGTFALPPREDLASATDTAPNRKRNGEAKEPRRRTDKAAKNREPKRKQLKKGNKP